MPSHLTRGRLLGTLGALVVGLVLTVAAATLVGPVRARPWGDAVARRIVLETRLPRVLLAATVGAGLATAGAGLQGLLQNLLACPHLLGVSGGAAVAGALALVAGVDPLSPAAPLAAFAGALATIAAVYFGARAGGRTTPHAILLVGVVGNAVAAAAIMLLETLLSTTALRGVLFWIIGTLSAQSYRLIAVSAIYVLVGSFWLGRHALALNLLATGEEGAAYLGVDIERVRRQVFLAASLLVGAAVSVSGMISFVGLIVPHLLRLVVGADQRLLLPASFLGGAIFLVAADTLARTVVAPTELPVGVVTALLGGPFFVALLRRQLREALA